MTASPSPDENDSDSTSLKPEDCRLAGTSLLISILGVLLLFAGAINMNLPVVGLLLSIAAIVCGSVARSRVSKSNGTFNGGGKALAAVIIGSVMLFLAISAALLPLFVR